jgi:hypothetical protein
MMDQVERTIARTARAEAIAKALMAEHAELGDSPHVARAEAIAEMVGAIALIAAQGASPVDSIMVALAGLSMAGSIAAISSRPHPSMTSTPPSGVVS